jgi:dinuclear metal center YbgI/SA1388 family protein
MDKIIEKFAPLELAEPWDCSGWIVRRDVDAKRVMLALTVTDDVVRQARKTGCDMIVSHHPLFFVPFEFADMPIYCAHTNLDRAKGGTTDALLAALGFRGTGEGFIRYIELDTTVDEFAQQLKTVSQNIRLVNNKCVQKLKRIAFCAGSGSDFIPENADAFVTGDIKFHTALESDIVLFDIGHFESEIPVLKVLAELLPVETVFANEKSPFLTC